MFSTLFLGFCSTNGSKQRARPEAKAPVSEKPVDHLFEPRDTNDDLYDETSAGRVGSPRISFDNETGLTTDEEEEKFEPKDEPPIQEHEKQLATEGGGEERAGRRLRSYFSEGVLTSSRAKCDHFHSVGLPEAVRCILEIEPCYLFHILPDTNPTSSLQWNLQASVLNLQSFDIDQKLTPLIIILFSLVTRPFGRAYCEYSAVCLEPRNATSFLTILPVLLLSP